MNPDDFQDPRERFRRLLSESEEGEQSLSSGASQEPEPEITEEDTAPIKVDEPHPEPPPFGGRKQTPTGQKSTQDISPLPKRVSEEDSQATQISPSAFSPRKPRPKPNQYRPNVSTPSPALKIKQPQTTQSGASPDTAKLMSCALRVTFIGLFLIIVIALCVVSVLFYQYYRIAATLPNIADLRQQASQFETTRILDRNGNLLYEILDPNAGRRTYVPLEKISPYLVAATIATEDKEFYSHPGFDLFAIIRAFYQNYQSGDTVSGASTITQQLARTLLFSPEERVEQTYQRKMREAILAAEITRRYSKDEILELYLNEIYYGNLAYGVEAAAETYFKTTAENLTLGQAAFLAGLPQAPAVYDIYSNPTATYSRMEDVLVLMYELSQEEGCIYVSNSSERVCVDPVMVTDAVEEIRGYDFQPVLYDIRYPHWVFYVRSLLEAQYDPQTIYRSGFTVYTTLDPTLQDLAQESVSSQVSAMADQHVTDGALVAIRPDTGEILAMVGSPDFYNESISGQINMAISPRQPGSAIKPLTYLAAFKKGWTPATLIWDVPSEFPPSGRPDDTRPPYVPVNYDGKFHGPVTVRYALGSSYNIPAVKTLQFVGIYDDPAIAGEDGLIAFAKQMGITTLTRSDYGLSLTLGGGEVTLLELTGAYAVIANGGVRVPPVAITRILDYTGNVVYQYQPPPAEQVIRPEHAFLMSSILSDNKARTPAFGANSVLKLPFQAAVKTGTTNDFRDNWTLGYTPDLAIGVWFGNADYTPMQNTSGVRGAAPVWAEVMVAAIQQLTGGNPRSFTRPPGVVDQVICAVSGTYPSPWCPEQEQEVFAADQPPLPKEQDLWQKVVVDTWTGLRASTACSEFTEEIFALNVSDSWAKKWIRKTAQGQAWAKSMGFSEPLIFSPSRECQATDPRPKLQFTSPGEGETVTTTPLYIFGIADADNGFGFVSLDFGFGSDPEDWHGLMQTRNRYPQSELMYTWDVVELPAGMITLRLVLYGTEGNYAVRYLHLNLEVPTPTPQPTATPTDTPIPTETTIPLPIETFWPTPTESPSATPTPG